MFHWKTLRISLLAITFSSVLLVLVKLIFYSTIALRRVTPFTFPASVPLPEWQLVASTPLNDQTKTSAQELPGRHYRYIQKNLALDIEMRYLIDTDGDVDAFIKKHTSHSSSDSKNFVVLHQQKGVGFSRLFIHQNRAYLSACINPRGGSTVTGKQFRQNRNEYDLNLNRMSLWLLAQEPLRDERCLWAYLSVPLQNYSQKDIYVILEKVWLSWYQLWSPRFPRN
jgi:cyanosortase A-associated protein